MFDTNTILTTVKSPKRSGSGAIPRGWHVFRAKKLRFLTAGIVAALSTFYCLFSFQLSAWQLAVFN